MLSRNGSISAILERQDCFQSGFLPPELLTTGQLLVISSQSHGGLFIRKPFYMDFAGPGSAIGCSFDISATAVYGIGSIHVTFPQGQRDRQQAYRDRTTYSDRIAQITRQADPDQRATLLVHSLCQWVGSEQARQLPCEWLAQVVGVHPQRIQLAWDRRWVRGQSVRSFSSLTHGQKALAPDQSSLSLLT